MSPVLAALSLLVPALTGALALRALLARHAIPAMACASIGAVLGVGVASGVQFMWLRIWGRASAGSIALELLGLVLAVGAFALARRGRPRESGAEVPASAVCRWLQLLAVLLVAGTGVRATGALIELAHGGWDAWAIWNLRARFLFHAGAQWRSAFSPLLMYSHPDYPLLLPLTVVRGWVWSGSATTLVPRVVAGFFLVAAGGVIHGALLALRGRTAAALGASVLFAAPVVVLNGSTQYADLPVAVFVGSGLALLMLADVHPRASGRLVALSGLAFGLAAWTKNEGLLFVVSVLAAQALVLWRCAGWKAALLRVGRFGLGLAPLVAVLLLFKQEVATSNDLIGNQSAAHALRALSEPSRYATILRAVASQLLGGTGLWKLPLTLLVVAAVWGLDLPRRERPGRVTALLTLLLSSSGFFVVYLLTPADLAWHLRYSLDRVLLQLWPGFVLVAVAALRPLDAPAAQEARPPPASP